MNPGRRPLVGDKVQGVHVKLNNFLSRLEFHKTGSNESKPEVRYMYTYSRKGVYQHLASSTYPLSSYHQSREC